MTPTASEGERGTSLEYVLVTPVRNEADYIEHTLASVAAQIHPPKRWIVVSDGSTDGTDELVKKYQARFDWIELIRTPGGAERSFASKALAFAAGYERVKDLSFDVIGNLDADVSFEPDYMGYLVEQFARDERLGVAGTHYIEGTFHSFEDSYINVHHVNGQCQLFRRACYEAIGGYQPIPGGGIDWLAVTSARMKGWRTYSFGEKVFRHHKPMGQAATGVLGARFHYGQKDYFLGGHVLWELARGIFQMGKKPYVVGGLALLAGYFCAWARRCPRPISNELIAFHQNEQLCRLRSLVGKATLRRNTETADGGPQQSRVDLP